MGTARGGGSSSAQLCVLAGCERPLSSCERRKPTGPHCTRLRGGPGPVRATDQAPRMNNSVGLLKNVSLYGFLVLMIIQGTLILLVFHAVSIEFPFKS